MKKFLLSIALCCAATNFFAQTTAPGNLINEGKAALEAKNYQEAFTKFSTYLTQTNNQDSVIAYNCGVCADKIKKPEEALKYFDIAIQKKYNLGNAYVGKAGALKDLKKDSEYLATLKEGIEAAPENKTLKRLHANYYLNAGIKHKRLINWMMLKKLSNKYLLTMKRIPMHCTAWVHFLIIRQL